MKRLSKTKKIIISATSAVLAVGTIITAITVGKYGETYYSFEYIEKLKESYTDSTMNLLEIAPSASESILSYTVEGSEPIANWYKIATMYNDQADRESYVKTIFNNLKSSGLLSSGNDDAPLKLVNDYDEWYPWETTLSEKIDKDKVMNLDAYETAFEKGTMTQLSKNDFDSDEEKAEYLLKNGYDYNANYTYDIAALTYKNLYQFADLKSKTGTLKKASKNLMLSEGNKNGASKVFALDSANKTISVFGSNTVNWKNAESMGFEAYYDTALLNKSSNSYTIPVESGKKYVLSFDALTKYQGKDYIPEKSAKEGTDKDKIRDIFAQVTIIPLNEAGNVVKYEKNYSKQNYLWSEYFNAANGESNYTNQYFQFSVPKYTTLTSKDKKISKVLIRFDVPDIETALYVKNIGLYEYEASGVVNEKDSIELSAKTNKTADETTSVQTIEAKQDYILSYHIENPNGAEAKVEILNNSDSAITSTVSNITSGTYQVKFNSGNNTRIKLKFSIKGVYYSTDNYGNKHSETSNVYLYNIALCKDESYIPAGDATHRQKYEYFSTGVPGSNLSSTNTFNYSKWFESGSNAVMDSNKEGIVKGFSNGIIQISSENNANTSTRYNKGTYVPSAILYYMPVDRGSDYQLKFRVQPKNDGDQFNNIVARIHFYDNNRTFLKNYTLSYKVSKDDIEDTDGYFITDFKVPEVASYIQLSFENTVADQETLIDYVGVYKWEKASAFYYNLKFTKVDPLNFTDADNGTALYVISDSFHIVGTVGEDGFTPDSGRKYYVYDEPNNRYLVATSEQLSTDHTNLYLPGGNEYNTYDQRSYELYEYAGTYGDEDSKDGETFVIDVDTEYYTAQINYDGFVEATLDNTYGDANKDLEIYDSSKNKTGKTRKDYPDDEINKGIYYVKVNTVSTTPDLLHPYYLEITPDGFVTDDNNGKDRLLFILATDSYTYAGRGDGQFKFTPDSSKEYVTILTKVIFYQGKIINNNWFQRKVLDCDREDYSEWIAWKTKWDGFDFDSISDVDEREKLEKEMESTKPDTQIELEKFNVSVTTYTPDYLNSLDVKYKDIIEDSVTKHVLDENCKLSQALTGFELVCFSSGLNVQNKKYASFQDDFSDDVEYVLEQKLLKQTDSDESFLPVIADVNLLSNKNANIKKLATKIFTEEVDITDVDEDGNTVVTGTKTVLHTTGGVDGYIYRFDAKDLPGSVKFISNSSFIKDIDETNKSYKDEKKSEYFEVWDNISYENNLRELKGKYRPLDSYVSEASIIRHILNYKGMRNKNSKENIRILEIQPSTDISQLTSSGKWKDNIANGKIDVRVWFDPEGNVYDTLGKEEQKTWEPQDLTYSYNDANGVNHSGVTKFTITTMATGELVGKIEDIAECYDLVFIGASVENLGSEYFSTDTSSVSNLPTEAESKTVKIDDPHNKDNGDVVPNYIDEALDGLFYYSVGDKYIAAASGLNRVPISGLNYDDYSVIAGLWFVDSSDVELRANGNDITDTKMEQIKAFISQGLPVVVSDSLSLQDFSSELKIKISGKTYYQREGRTTYLPGYEGKKNYSFECNCTGTHVLLEADLIGAIPAGAVVSFDWFYQTAMNTEYAGTPVPEVANDYKNWWAYAIGSIGNIFGADWGSVNSHDNVISIDTNGDGIDDKYFIDFIPENSKYQKNAPPAEADYYGVAKFDFSNCKNTFGNVLKYNGLYGDDSKVNIYSNKMHVSKEDRQYTVKFFSSTSNLSEMYKFKSFFKGYGIDVSTNTRTMTVSVTPVPEEANDNVLYRAMWAYNIFHDWRYTTAEWLNGEDGNAQIKAEVKGEKKYEIQYGVFRTSVDGTDYELFNFTCNSHYLSNRGFNLFFNDEGDESKASRTSVGGYGTFESTYTGDKTRTATVHGYKLYLKDKDHVKVNSAEGYKGTDGGYTLSGNDVFGQAITGPTAEISTSANVLDNRVDTSSNMFDFLSTSFDKYENIFTENQVERIGETYYRDLLSRYVNLSEPEIVVVGEYPKYPTPLTGRSFSVSFKIVNNTDIDTMSARYDYDFYVDENGDGQYSDVEKVECSISNYSEEGLLTSSQANGNHVYTITASFDSVATGVKPWKLKVTKKGEPGAHASLQDYAYLEANAAGSSYEINAIQVLPGDWDPEYISLKNPPSNYKRLVNERDRFDYMYNEFKGSVFLNNVYISDELINGMKNGKKLTRYIYYVEDAKERYIYENGLPVSINMNPNGLTKGPANETYKYDPTKFVHHIEFQVGTEYKVNIYFSNVADLNDSYTNTSVTGILDDFNMVIMGFGDDYNKLILGKNYNAIHTDETLGFNANAALALETVIEDGLPVLFCHDTTSYNVNFVNYLLNDAYSFFNDIANKVTNWWFKTVNEMKTALSNLFGSGTDYTQDEVNKYNGSIHSSRLKQGYYTNLILRDPLGLDAYGASAKIKERCGYKYDDSNLKSGHSYNNLYSDNKKNNPLQYLFTTGNNQSTPDNAEQVLNDIHNVLKDENGNTGKFDSYNEWKAYYRSLDSDGQDAFKTNNKGSVAYNVLMMEENGYKIAWTPTNSKEFANTETTPFAQGFTTYTVRKFKNSESAENTPMTNVVTQVNQGQITLYPYDINSYNPSGEIELFGGVTQSVNKTHTQYFQVNLNENQYGETATVWYCLANGSSYDNKLKTPFRNDCENAYFIYTKGNVTYTGAGHLNTFNTFEAKLFLNTLIASSRSVTKVPKVRFYEKDGTNVQDYMALVGTTEKNTKQTSGARTFVTEKDTNNNSYVIWLDDLHFKINNANQRTENKDRKVSFYYLDDSGNEVAINDATVYLGNTVPTINGVEDKSKAANLGKITPGVVYSLKIPDSVLKTMVSVSGSGDTKSININKMNQVIYVRVELTDEEQEQKQKISDEIAAGDILDEEGKIVAGSLQNYDIKTFSPASNESVSYQKAGSNENEVIVITETPNHGEKGYKKTIETKNKSTGATISREEWLCTEATEGDGGKYVLKYKVTSGTSSRTETETVTTLNQINTIYYYYTVNGTEKTPHFFILDSTGTLYDVSYTGTIPEDALTGLGDSSIEISLTNLLSLS